ncbi:MAG: hypothetical protein D6760_10950 [Deltaproteobacteria bacterium]|nr:MAG: hypothetical protein D6760_10950 [Deltaproteobacteria bacterium]
MSYPLFLWLTTIVIGSLAAYVVLGFTASFFQDELRAVGEESDAKPEVAPAGQFEVVDAA